MSTSRSTVQTGPKRTPLKRVIGASIAGTTLEWYDFFLYGIAAALVFPAVFFPDSDPLTGTLLSFVTFSVGFVARPAGALIAGHFGDRIGRTKVLMITIIGMGIASFLIGCIPDYSTIGVWAPIILCVLRFAQGLAMGGEWAGAVLLISENTSGKHRGFFASLIQSSSPLGNVLATGVIAVLNLTMSGDAFQAYGWRIAFWLSAVVTIVGIFIRLKVNETPAFQKLKSEAAPVKIPLVNLLRENWREVLACTGVRVGSDVAWTIFAVFSITYVTTELGQSRSVALNATLIAAGVQVITHGLAGALSDRVGRRPLAIVGALCLMGWVFAFFPLLNNATAITTTIGIVVGLMFHSMIYGPMAAFFVESFPVHTRFSGSSLSHQVASMIGGGLAPMIAVAILSSTGSTGWIVVYVVVALLCALGGALALRETRGKDLRQESMTPQTS